MGHDERATHESGRLSVAAKSAKSRAKRRAGAIREGWCVYNNKQSPPGINYSKAGRIPLTRFRKILEGLGVCSFRS